MSTLTFKTDAYLTLDGDSGVMFCTEAERLADTALEIDIEVEGDEWNVTEIRMHEPTVLKPERLRILTGPHRESAMGYIIDHLVSDVMNFVAENRDWGDDDDDSDFQCDQRREAR